MNYQPTSQALQFLDTADKIHHTINDYFSSAHDVQRKGFTSLANDLRKNADLLHSEFMAMFKDAVH